MKKTLLLSVVASTMIMAGGDIAPVEPAVVPPAPVAVVAPVVACSDGWKFNGQGVLYYQTGDNNNYIVKSGAGVGEGNLFDKDFASANAGLSLKAENSDLIGGIGFGARLIGLGTLGLDEDVVSNVMQKADGNLNGGAITELYLTYGIGNTKLKLGRQELPLALSPFAHSEKWNVFENTFEALTIVNTDIPDTTLVGAYVNKSNRHSNLNSFKNMSTVNGAGVAGDGAYMLTAQNRSFDGLALTGTYYYIPNMIGSDNVNVLWGDAGFDTNLGSNKLNIGLQGGSVMLDTARRDDTTAFGAKIGGKYDIFKYGLAYSNVNDGDARIENIGTSDVGYLGAKTPLYTQLIVNQAYIKQDAKTYLASIGADVFGGSLGLDYSLTDRGIANPTAIGLGGDFKEIDLSYKTKVGPLNLLGAYIYQDDDNKASANNIIRFVGRYNF